VVIALRRVTCGAKRELDRLMSEAGVNSESYEPTRIGTYDEFAERWEREIVPLMSPAVSPVASRN